MPLAPDEPTARDRFPAPANHETLARSDRYPAEYRDNARPAGRPGLAGTNSQIARLGTATRIMIGSHCSAFRTRNCRNVMGLDSYVLVEVEAKVGIEPAYTALQAAA